MSLNYMVDSVEFEGQMNGDSKIRFSSSLLHEYHLIIQNKPKFILVLYLKPDVTKLVFTPNKLTLFIGSISKKNIVDFSFSQRLKIT